MLEKKESHLQPEVPEAEEKNSSISRSDEIEKVEKKVQSEIIENIVEFGDPDQYFLKGVQKKVATQIAPEFREHWKNVNYGFLVADTKEGGYAIAETAHWDKGNLHKGVVIASTYKENKVLLYEKEVSQEVQDEVLDACRRYVSQLTPLNRYQWTKHIENYIFRDKEITQAQAVEVLYFGLLHEFPTVQKDSKIPKEVMESLQLMTRNLAEEQQKTFLTFVTEVFRHIPIHNEELFLHSLESFIEYALKKRDLGSDYREVFDAMLQVQDNPKEYYDDFVDKQHVKKFPILDQIHAPVTTYDDFEKRLHRLSVEPFPNFDHYSVNEQSKHEVVALDKVVGGTEISTSWENDDESSSRKASYMFRMATALQKGSDSIMREPIHLNKLKGKYYVSTDGRHRIAVLKVLGVKYISAVVDEYE